MVNYWITELEPPAGSPAGTRTEAYGVAPGGSAVGGYHTPGVGENSGEGAAVEWTSAGTIVLENPSPSGSLAFDANGGSVVVGYAWPYPPTFPKLWHTFGNEEDLFGAVGGFGGASAVNAKGRVTGWVAKEWDESDARPFTYDSPGGAVKILDPLPEHQLAYGLAINDAGHVAGVSYKSWGSGRRLYLYRAGKPEDLGPGQASALNSNDQIAGGMFFSGYSAPRACRVDASGSSPAAEDLGHSALPGYSGSNAYGINDDGVVVGDSFSYEHGKLDRAFVHFPAGDPDAGFHDLQPLLLNGGGWELYGAFDINNDGSIVGTGAYEGQYRGYQLERATPPQEEDPPLPYLPEKAVDALLVFVQLIGGVESGGGGMGIFPSGKPIPIPPHEWRNRWREMSSAQRDLVVGIAIQKLTEILADPERRRRLDRAGQEIIESARAELRKTMPDRR